MHFVFKMMHFALQRRSSWKRAGEWRRNGRLPAARPRRAVPGEVPQLVRDSGAVRFYIETKSLQWEMKILLLKMMILQVRPRPGDHRRVHDAGHFPHIPEGSQADGSDPVNLVPADRSQPADFH